MGKQLTTVSKNPRIKNISTNYSTQVVSFTALSSLTWTGACRRGGEVGGRGGGGESLGLRLPQPQSWCFEELSVLDSTPVSDPQWPVKVMAPRVKVESLFTFHLPLLSCPPKDPRLLSSLLGEGNSVLAGRGTVSALIRS